MRRTTPLLFGVILLLYLAAGATYALVTPAWQVPDEPAHYNYVHYLATGSGFPELVAGCYNQAYLDKLKAQHFPPDLPVHGLCYEYHQPPLYYALAGPVFTLTKGSLVGLRLFSVGLGAGVVVLAFFVGRAVFPRRAEIALGAMALAAFVPMHLAMMAAVNNDALAELLLAALLLLLCRRLLGLSRPSWRGDGLLGVLLGLGLLTKLTIYIALPLVVVALWWTAGGWRPLARQAATIYGLALLLALPWYGRNAALYGRFDLLGLARHDEVVVGQLRTADFVAQVGLVGYLARLARTTFHSWWGQFGWMAVPMDGRTYLFLALFSLLGLAGLVGWLARPNKGLEPGQRQALALLALATGLVGLAYGWYNLGFVQFQGRYLFPALIPVSLFLALGLRETCSLRRAWWPAAGLAMALAWVAAAGLAGGNLDKRALLLLALALAGAGGRAWLRVGAAPWLMALAYAGLAGLALLSPFWFILPYLS